MKFYELKKTKQYKNAIDINIFVNGESIDEQYYPVELDELEVIGVGYMADNTLNIDLSDDKDWIKHNITHLYTIIFRIWDKDSHRYYRYRIDIEAESKKAAVEKAEKIWKETHANTKSHISYIDVYNYSQSDVIIYTQFTTLDDE